MRPRLDQIRICRLPCDRQWERIVEAAYLRLGLPLLAHLLGELVGHALQSGGCRSALAGVGRRVLGDVLVEVLDGVGGDRVVGGLD
ncbi:MAG: hypothetical protein JO362_10420 [Streptomycetaceae bacterium]|nr:hypothetical protein [Streptomycetaceae bacterium]